MAQNLEPRRLDNRGGFKPKTSTKKMFIYRVERSKHEELKAFAIKLNEGADDKNDTDKTKKLLLEARDKIELIVNLVESGIGVTNENSAPIFHFYNILNAELCK